MLRLSILLIEDLYLFVGNIDGKSFMSQVHATMDKALGECFVTFYGYRYLICNQHGPIYHHFLFQVFLYHCLYNQ